MSSNRLSNLILIILSGIFFGGVIIAGGTAKTGDQFGFWLIFLLFSTVATALGFSFLHYYYLKNKAKLFVNSIKGSMTTFSYSPNHLSKYLANPLNIAHALAADTLEGYTLTQSSLVLNENKMLILRCPTPTNVFFPKNRPFHSYARLPLNIIQYDQISFWGVDIINNKIVLSLFQDSLQPSGLFSKEKINITMLIKVENREDLRNFLTQKLINARLLVF